MLKKAWWFAVPILGLLVFVVVSSNNAAPTNNRATTTVPTVVSSFPHDPRAFCQGLVVEGDILLEGTGQYGNSTLRKVKLESGEVIKQMSLRDNLFGEGITVLGDEIYQLTWKSQICVVYDKATFKFKRTLPYKWSGYREGWGLADDGEQLFLSDGSYTIRVIDPTTFKMRRKFQVKDGRRKISKLNELEYVNGEILANIWHSDLIVRIDPDNGTVKGWIDCRHIYPANQRPDREHVLNGIAYDEESGRLFVTGKNWPKIYEIKIQ